jgi:outer membrane protein assembly factor BamB
LGAFDLITGDHLWSYCSAELAYRKVLGATDDVVVMSQNQQIIAVDAHDGTELWHQSDVAEPLGWAQGPFAGGDVTVIELGDGGGHALVGVDARTGAERWRVAKVGSEFLVANAQDVVTVASNNHVVRALDRSTGREADSTSMSDGSQFAVDARTGALVWYPPPGLNSPTASGAFVVGVVPYPSGPGPAPGSPPPPPPTPQISVFDGSTGETLWTADGSPSYGNLWALDESALYISGAGGIESYELATGTVRWRHDPRAAGDPQQSDGKSVILLWEGHLEVLDAADGKSRWAADSPLGSTLMSTTGYNSTSVFVSVNTRPFLD